MGETILGKLSIYTLLEAFFSFQGTFPLLSLFQNQYLSEEGHRFIFIDIELGVWFSC